MSFIYLSFFYPSVFQFIYPSIFLGPDLAGRIGMAASDPDVPFLFMDDIYFTGKIDHALIKNKVALFVLSSLFLLIGREKKRNDNNIVLQKVTFYDSSMLYTGISCKTNAVFFFCNVAKNLKCSMVKSWSF